MHFMSCVLIGCILAGFCFDSITFVFGMIQSHEFLRSDQRLESLL